MALFRGRFLVAWAGALTIIIKFITFGGTFVAFAANLSIKIGCASGYFARDVVVTPGCIRP